MRCLCLLLAVPLALACGSDHHATTGNTPSTTPGNSAAINPAATTRTTISWAFWGDADEVTIDQSIVRLFEKEHPEVHVETRSTDYNSYQQQFKQWMQSDDPPDVAFLSDIPAWAPSGVLADLSPMTSAENYDLKDFYPGLLDLFRYKSDIYGIPRDNDTKVIFYNKSLFDAAKLPYPQPGWTWDDLRRDAIALTAMGQRSQYGFAFESQAWWRLWVWQNGGALYDEPLHPSKLLIDSPQAIGALRFLRDLIYTDKVTPPVDTLKSSDQIAKLFTRGQLAMAFGNHALVPAFANVADLHWGVVGLPKMAQQVNYFGGAGYVIGAHSQHKEAAWTFLKWLVSTRGEAIFTESGLIVPSRISVGNSNLFLHPPSSVAAASPAPEIGQTFLSETALGRGMPAFPGSTDVANAIDAGLDPIWSQGADPQALVEALVPKIDAMLAALR